MVVVLVRLLPSGPGGLGAARHTAGAGSLSPAQPTTSLRSLPTEIVLASVIPWVLHRKKEKT